jgi:dipeptidyl aminopeptidase/acylaminoacyl peptidase
VRIGLVRGENVNAVIYRDDADQDWRELPLPSRGHDMLRPYVFDPDRNTLYVEGFNEQDRWSIFPYDLTDGSLGEAICSDPDYDAIGNGAYNQYAGLRLSRPLFSGPRDRLLGITYAGESPRVIWLDDEYAKIQAAVDQALAGHVNLLVNQSADNQRLLFLSFSDRAPGTYHLLDRKARTFKPLGSRMDWIDPRQMSPMLGIKYEARDGTTIHGYLTVPAGHQPKDLPLVVLPHGGPWVRDNWGFDPLVQLIASRGYAVLQMNYRGSKGYGSAFGLLGKRQVGRGIQDDIEDATRWAIAAGVADPERIAIAGANYGGFSALFALGKSPDLYQCGISLNGVTDWAAIFERAGNNREMQFARRMWIDRIGNPEEEPGFFAKISPVNFAAQINAPVLLIQGREDRTVPAQQAKDMAAALKKSRRDARLIWLKNTGHSLSNQRARTLAFTEIVDFLETHLGPGVPFLNSS